MTRRLLASSSIAILGLGLMLAPEAAFARGGGFAGPRALSVSGGIRPPTFHMRHARPAPLHHRGWFRYGVPAAAWGAPYWYGMDYNPAIYPVSYGRLPDDTPAYPVVETAPSPRHISVIVRPSRCNSQTMKVPSESGGERAITVERC
jgi:hypothetical protein